MKIKYGFVLPVLVVLALVVSSCLPPPDFEEPVDPPEDPIPEGWIFCANENEYCSFSGTALVRYGLDGSYYYQEHNEGVLCSNDVFGDPIIGQTKQCHYSYDEQPPEEPPENGNGETPPPSHEIEYSAPITITSGGTYSGAWESTDREIPAIQIRTSEPVIIENSHIRSLGHHIRSHSGYNAHVTVRNVSGLGLPPTKKGDYTGRFIILDTYRYFLAENSYMEQTSGIYLHMSTEGAMVKVLRNRAVNIDGRRSDGSGGYDGFYAVQFVQFDKGRDMVDTEVAWNEVINEPYDSFVEDVVSLFETSGIQNNPIRIHNNYFQGAYPNNPATDGYSGGGIMLGDSTGKNMYLHAHNNQIVSTTNYGIAISAGAHSRINNNRIISCGYVTNPSTGQQVALRAQNVGAYIWNMHQHPSFMNNSGSGNEIAWKGSGSNLRNDWWVPDATLWKGNTAIHSTPIPCSAEEDEYNRWQQKLQDNNMVIGLVS